MMSTDITIRPARAEDAEGIATVHVGTWLTAAVAGELLQRGMQSMLVWAFRDNPTRAFYEALGGGWVGEKTVPVGGVELPHVAYGWPDIRVLVNPDDMS